MIEVSPLQGDRSQLEALDRTRLWRAQALEALHRHYDTECEAGHLAAVILWLLHEREVLMRDLSRIDPAQRM